MHKLLKNKKAKITALSAALIIVILAIGVFSAALYFGYIGLNSEKLQPATVTGGYHTGALNLFANIKWAYDDSNLFGTSITTKFYHADKKTIIGTAAAGTVNVTGNLLPTDQDIIYMQVDTSGQSTYFADPATTVTRNSATGITDWFLWNDYGTAKYGFTINIAKALGTNTAPGQSAWQASYNPFVSKAQTPTDVTSITNATTISHTVAGDYYTQMYIPYTGEGYTYKLAYMYLQTANVASNGTFMFNGTLQLKDITFVTGQGQSQNIQSPQVRAFDYNSNKTFAYINEPNSWTSEANDMGLYNWRGGGGSSNTITFHWYALKWPGTTYQRIRVTAYFYYILPNGSVGSVNQVIELRAAS